MSREKTLRLESLPNQIRYSAFNLERDSFSFTGESNDKSRHKKGERTKEK